MSVDTERYYVRFKGRVLGPIDQVKTLDLIRRGQITRQHELSTDGNNWRAASEYPKLFSGQSSGPASGTADVQPQKKLAPKNADVWYANIGNENKGPVAEEVIQGWVNDKSVQPDTLVWKAGLNDWQPAQTLRPDWFARAKSTTTVDISAASEEQSTEDSNSNATLLLRAHGWIQFLSITGLVIGVLSLLASIASFFGVATRGGTGPAKVMAVILSICLVAGAVAWFVASLLLLKYSTRLSVLKYRRTTHDLIAATDAANRFWKFTGIATLIWLIVAGLVLAAIYLLGLSIPIPYKGPDPIAG